MKIIRYAVFSFLLLFFIPTQSQTDYNRIDSLARAVKYEPVETLPLRITEHCNTDLEKVRAIFVWIADNIAYDLELFHDEYKRIEAYPTHEATIAYVLKQKKAVCWGYALLFQNFCEELGINSITEKGYARSWADGFESDRQVNHAWNMVKIGDRWHLLDVTWASGYSNLSHTKFIKRFKEFWFLTKPKYFIYTHFPENPRHTLLKANLSLDDFYDLPLIHHQNFFKYRIKQFRSNTLIADADSVIRIDLGVKINRNRISVNASSNDKDKNQNQLNKTALSREEGNKKGAIMKGIKLLPGEKETSKIRIKLLSKSVKTIKLSIGVWAIVEYKVKFQENEG